MNDIKNDNIEEVVESEEVLEVALADDSAEDNEENNASVNENDAGFTEGELSGLTEKQRRRKEIFDKITTGLLIALMASPVAIVIYIFLWFLR